MARRPTRLKDLFFGAASSAKIEFFRSLFVGAAAFFADFLTLTLCKEWLLLSTAAAASFGFAVGVTVNYLMSVFWAFSQSNVKNPYIRFVVFVTIAAVGLLINNALILLFDGYLAEQLVFGNLLDPARYYMPGKIVATIVVFVWNFASRKLLLFRGERGS